MYSLTTRITRYSKGHSDDWQSITLCNSLRIQRLLGRGITLNMARLERLLAIAYHRYVVIFCTQFKYRNR